MKADRTTYLDAVYALDRVRYARLVSGFPNLFPWQITFLRSGHKRKVLDCSRQAGKSSIVSVIPTHTGRFKPGSSSFILAATEQQSVYVMNKIKLCMSRDPDYPKITRTSDSLIVLENGSRIEVLCATDKSARGPSKPDVIIPDEASRIEDGVITSGIVPMLNDNPTGELIVPSTPNGRKGFFYRVFNNAEWERYYVRSPYTPTSGLTLRELGSEEDFIAEQAAKGVIAAFSPRHKNLKEQLEQLQIMGQQMYRQEDCGEFVEPNEQLFSYDDIRRAFDRGDDLEPLRSGIQTRDDFPVFDQEE